MKVAGQVWSELRVLNMAEHAFKSIRTGGLFSKRIKVLFETKLDRMLPRGEVNTAAIYNEDGAKKLGHCKFTFEGDNGTVDSFIFQDWSQKYFATALLKHAVSIMKKKGVKAINAEIYDKDNTTIAKLDTFKAVKFRMDAGGATTGYNRYLFKRKI